MKTILITLVAALLITAPKDMLAQKPVKVVISVPGAQDEACKTRIENYLKREYGVASSLVNFRRHTVTVQYIADRTNVENIKTAIANLGYDADDVTANPDAYKRLPKTCQHPVEKKENTGKKDGGNAG